jgi:PAS domain S-box-containing protein
LFESSGTDGKTFQISYTGMMFQGKKAMLMILQDITDKKEVDKRVRLLAHSLESISECVSVTDNNDILIYVNKSFLHTYGYTAEELIGQPTSLLRAPDIAIEHVRDILPETIEGGWRGEIMNRKKDGTLFPILLSTSIIRNEQGKPIALIGVALDITEMRKSRAELIKAKEQAVESNNLKTAFLNNMSHEIRTPMNHIIGFSSLMADAIGEDKDTYAEIIQKSSNQLLSLIENVILLSRLQSEKMEIVNHELNPELLLSNIARMFDSSELHNDVKIHLLIPENQKNLTILADHEKIRLVLINLTSNAVKYTFKGSVELSFSATENEITFVVSDSGIGIPVHEQEKIFESFYRGEEALHLVIGGTGLGLSIVRELVKTMGGNIGLSSSPGKGSRFFFTIPFKQVESIQQAYEEPVPIQSSRNDLTILVVDDEMINYLYLEILLKSSIRKIDHARNGQEAIEMARKNNYDMILMDLKMPGINGFDATSIIRNSNPQIPIIAQTAYATHEDMEKALLAGCNDLISKPIRKEVLMEMIAKYR